MKVAAYQSIRGRLWTLAVKVAIAEISGRTPNTSKDFNE
jgi:hypothetical protein